MGKKSKSGSTGKLKLTKKSIDPSMFPDPLPPLEEDIGSLRTLDHPHNPGALRKNFGSDGYDDGGVGDLKLAVDLNDHVLRRKKGETNFVIAVQTDSLPRMREGQWRDIYRRDQKVQLAQILFSEDSAGDPEAAQNPTKTSEVWQESRGDEKDEAKKQEQLESLRSAKFALRLSIILKEPACICLSLAEISKRYLVLRGKEGAEDALRCAKKAIEIATNEYYDVDEMAVEGAEKPEIKNHEKDATYQGLVNKNLLQYMPSRVADICLRSVYLHCGNALAALGREEEARETYEKIMPILAKETRSSRCDWERSSFYLNLGNSYSRQGNYEKASEYYDMAEQLGKDQLSVGDTPNGLALTLVSKRNRAFALKRAGKDEEAKVMMRQVIETSAELEKALVPWRQELKELTENQEAEKTKAVEELTSNATATADPSSATATAASGEVTAEG